MSIQLPTISRRSRQLLKQSLGLAPALLFCVNFLSLHAQVVINEGSNKNYSTLADEDGEYEDWIEIYNAGAAAVNLYGYSLSDNATPGEWVFPHQLLLPGEYLIVFCSGKNRYASSPFTPLVTDSAYSPLPGWNVHHFTAPFVWDGASSVVLNVCSYNSFYTENAVHVQTSTTYPSSLYTVADGVSMCGALTGVTAMQRPNIRLNGTVVGTGVLVNGPYDYPAPYGNWYWSARHQFLFPASELSAAGLTAGSIDSLAFQVVSSFPTAYEYVDLSMTSTGMMELGSTFIPPTGNKNHTNFRISAGGEIIQLFDPSGALISALNVSCGPGYDVSTGSFPDASSTLMKFASPTPEATNNTSSPATADALPPAFSHPSAVYAAPFYVSITDPNITPASIYYTLDGSDPDSTALLYTGTPVFIYTSTVIRARAYLPGHVPSTIASASYLFGVSHTTPIISVVTDPDNLFGPAGMFDNFMLDLLKAASVDYFDSTASHNLLFSQRAGIIMDGGWGSRGNPQRPFRIKWADGVVGEGPATGVIIPDRPARTVYSDFYLRNGSNQYLVLPYKDASQVKMMGDGSYNYYSAWRPVTVYINGNYWGLYELREKFNTEMFEVLDGATESTVEILSSSAMYGFVLRAVEGDVDNFYDAYNSYMLLDPADTSFWAQADQYFDMYHYHDYLIGELWMNNADWAFNYNNIKIYRSDATDFRWRYCLMDMEFGLLPNPMSDFSCTYDLLGQLMGWPSSDPNNPHLNIFHKGITNDRFRNYFINRFADQMNTLYLPSRVQAIENDMFNLTAVEMANEYARWGDPFTVPAQMTFFYNNHLTFQAELACRPEHARDQIQSNFSLPQQVDVTLDVYPPGAGQIRISTVTPSDYPWDGIYFDGVPIRIEAIALPGSVFSHWESNGLIADTTNSVFLDTLDLSSVLFKAHFVSTVGVGEPSTASLSVYPNPASDRLIVRSTKLPGALMRMRVTDVLSRTSELPFTLQGSSEYSLDVSHLSTGTYLLSCEFSDGSSEQVKFFKQ